MKADADMQDGNLPAAAPSAVLIRIPDLRAP